jgi:hypothetical protein
MNLDETTLESIVGFRHWALRPVSRLEKTRFGNGWMGRCVVGFSPAEHRLFRAAIRNIPKPYIAGLASVSHDELFHWRKIVIKSYSLWIGNVDKQAYHEFLDGMDEGSNIPPRVHHFKVKDDLHPVEVAEVLTEYRNYFANFWPVMDEDHKLIGISVDDHPMVAMLKMRLA